MDQRDSYTDELLSAYLDGELTPDERARVEQLLERSETHRQAWLELRSLRADFQALPAHRLGDGFAERVLAATRDAAEQQEQSPALATGGDGSGPRNWRSWAYAAITFAAALLLGALTIDWQSWLEPPRPVAVEDGRAPLADSESTVTQPAAPPGTDPSTTSADPKRDAEKGSPAAAADSAATPDPLVTKQAAADAASAGPDSAAGPSGSSPRSPQPDASRAQVADAPERSITTPPAPVVAELPPSDQLLLVIDVFLTPEGMEAASVDQALAEHGVPFFASIPLDEQLEAALINSRFFRAGRAAAKRAGADRPREASEHAPQLVYVVTRGGLADELWRTMKERQKHFAAVFMDLAFKPEELKVFRELREAALATYVSEDRAAAAAREAELRRGAYRLVLPPTWRGEPTRFFTGSDELPPQPDRPAQKPPGAFLPGRLGENIVVELLFVVHATPR